MKRWPPYGTADGTEWHNGNPSTGERGSVIDARAVDHSQAEIVNAITRLGLTPNKDNLEQLGLAIQNAIAAATGGGETSGFVTMETARARLPIYPEILNSSGKMTVTSPSSGTLFVPATDTIRHRGIFDIAMSDLPDVERTFNLLASKVAHLRWSPAAGLQRFYLDDVVYNPLGLPETDATFDSTYDSILLARVVTDNNAAASITSLVNRPVLQISEIIQVTNVIDANTLSTLSDVISSDYDWARTPTTCDLYMTKWLAGRELQRYSIGPLGSTATELFDNNASVTANRYRSAHTALMSFTGPQACFRFSARA